jgi:SAM-dependent methyltransferase
MGKWLQFGAGPNELPPPWENLTVEHDIRKPLRFETGSVSRILMEHVLEHVPYMAALSFLQEARRVLEPGGVLRVSVPDVGRFVDSFADVDRKCEFNARAAEYAEALAQLPQGTLIAAAPKGEEQTHEAMLQLLAGWGHQCTWTMRSLAGALLTFGFAEVWVRQYGEGLISGCDGHHLSVGHEANLLESTILEAVR